MNACVCSCQDAVVVTLNPFLDLLLQVKLSPEDYENWLHRPTNENGLRFYDEEKEYLYPGKSQLKKFVNLANKHRDTDDKIWKIIEQLLDNVVATAEGEEPADLIFEDEEEFKEKRPYNSKARANNPDSKVTCAYCKLKFKNDDSLKQHVSKQKDTKCYRIHKLSGLPAKLERRQELAAKPHGCKYCEKRFASQASLNNHTRVAHTNVRS